MRAFPLLLLVTACAAGPSTLSGLSPGAALRGGADLHLHLSMSSSVFLLRGEPGDGSMAVEPGQGWVNAVSVEQLHNTGVTLVFSGMWPTPTWPHNGVDHALRQVRALEDFTARRQGFTIAQDSTEARRIIARGGIAVLPQLEGGHAIKREADVDVLYAAGVRVITLMHFIDTGLGGAAAGQIPRIFHINHSCLNETGLSDLGIAVVTRMVKLGMVIDLAHASDRLVEDVLKFTSDLDVPVIVSHTSARALFAKTKERSLPEDLAIRVLDQGGLIGLTFKPEQLEIDREDQMLQEHQLKTCDDLIAHWKHFATLANSRKGGVALGTDINGMISRPKAGGLCPNGIRNYGDLNQLWAALVASGVPRASLDGMGDRVLELLEKVEARADPKFQAAARANYANGKGRRAVFDAPP